MITDPVLVAEQENLEAAWRHLDVMRTTAAGTGEAGVDAAAAQALASMRAARLAALGTDTNGAPFFARIDRDADSDAGSDDPERTPLGHRVEVFHLGRRHIRDDAGDPIVIDWRAPIARAFYQATPKNRMRIRLRRRFGFREGTVSSYEDEHLDQGESLGLASDLLREEIERPRVGPMRDIVATIQPDQDDLVRTDLDTSLCIQGAPGTGKTAVGLHRAAYLLYTYPDRLRRSGVLVVGPNPAFLHYIAQVLPTLGEGGIEQATVTSLTGVEREPALEEAKRATLKGDARMAEVLHRAVQANVGRPSEDLVVIVGTRRYRISETRLRRYVEQTRRDGVRWALGRERLRQQIAFDVRRQREDAGGAPSDAEVARIARSASIKTFLDQVWPALSPATMLGRLYTDSAFRGSCANGLLDADEIDQLAWAKPPRSVKSAHWTAADLALLDELAGLIDGVSTYVHVVLDEAQDLSAMQCRLVARRCPTGSLTVLGDLAQATTPWAPRSWSDTLQHLGHSKAEVRPLTAGYRVPMAVLEIANRLLPYIAPEVPPATSVRNGEHSLTFVGRAALVETVAAATGVVGSIGVIVPDEDVATVLAQLRAANLDAQLLNAISDHDLVVVPATAAKGLEYDSVVLVEPAAIVAAESSRDDGLRRLYVSLTRAVSRLAIVHDRPLPVEMT